MTPVLSEAGVEPIDSITPLIAEKDREMFASVLSADEMRELTACPARCGRHIAGPDRLV